VGPRSFKPLELREPELLVGPGKAVRGDACQIAGELGDFDIAYLDPPYNQHRYFTNYHIWETLVAWMLLSTMESHANGLTQETLRRKVSSTSDVRWHQHFVLHRICALAHSHAFLQR